MQLPLVLLLHRSHPALQHLAPLLHHSRRPAKQPPVLLLQRLVLSVVLVPLLVRAVSPLAQPVTLLVGRAPRLRLSPLRAPCPTRQGQERTRKHGQLAA